LDSVTHLALGACTGELLLGKKLGKKAMLWGALAQSLPDADTLFSPFFTSDEGYLVHRGITHSILFVLVAGLLLGGIAYLPAKKKTGFWLLAFFFGFQLLLHDILDSCNSYGTGLLEPFSHHRFSVHLLYVADPLFTIGLLVAAIWLAIKGAAHPRRSGAAWRGIYLSAFYLCFAICCKVFTQSALKRQFTDQQLRATASFTTPAPLNCMLWYFVAGNSSGFYTAYRSVWDGAHTPVRFEYHPRDSASLKNIADKPLLQNLLTFADGYYTVSQKNGGYYFNILRFEQIQGWAVPNAPFAFSYPLASGADQGLLLQKGRLQGWNGLTINRYLSRIAGTTKN
jgi:inner membrane protein